MTDLLARADESTPADILGNTIWGLLLAAGHEAAPEGARRSGFDIVKPRDGGDDVHVVVLGRYEGTLPGYQTARISMLQSWHASLTAAGVPVAAVLHDGDPHALVAADNQTHADAVAARIWGAARA